MAVPPNPSPRRPRVPLVPGNATTKPKGRDRNEFGKRLRQFREDAGLSQNALARLAGLDPTSLSRMETTLRGNPRRSTVDRLCRALGWSPSHPNAQLLRSAAGYGGPDADRPVTNNEELRRIVMASVAEFNRWREGRDDDEVLDWSGADFSSADLRTVNLRRFMLVKANFENADLVRANLREANLESANLRVADLRGANLREANLCDADLSGADLRGAYLNAAKLKGANLKNADLRGADLRESDLREAILRKADFRRADLSNADLTSANLVDTNLIKADLLDAKLQGADLRRAQFRRRELRAEADIRGARFRNVSEPSERNDRHTDLEESDAADDHDAWNED